MVRRWALGAAAGLGLALSLPAGYVGWRVVTYAEEHEARKNALYRALADNDFGAAYATEADLHFFRQEFAFLDEATSEADRVVRLVRWLDENIEDEEAYTVHARRIYELRKGACEVHALAVAVLEAFGTQARWISSARSSPGFGFLEAWVDGRWALFQLRSGDPDAIDQGRSAWDLYQTQEPSLSVRTFWFMPGQSTTSFEGSVYPALFPLANVTRDPRVGTLFVAPTGIDVAYRDVAPGDALFFYRVLADEAWVAAGTVPEEFERIRASPVMARRRFYGRVADALGWTRLEHTPF
jgi:hypothetical protein